MPAQRRDRTTWDRLQTTPQVSRPHLRPAGLHRWRGPVRGVRSVAVLAARCARHQHVPCRHLGEVSTSMSLPHPGDSFSYAFVCGYTGAFIIEITCSANHARLDPTYIRAIEDRTRRQTNVFEKHALAGGTGGLHARAHVQNKFAIDLSLSQGRERGGARSTAYTPSLSPSRDE